MIRTNVIGHL